MEFLFLILIPVLTTGQNLMIKKYDQHTETQKRAYIEYLLFLSIGSLIFLLIQSGVKIGWNGPTVGYSVLFGGVFIFTIVCNVLAVNNGPLSLTSLVVSYSLIVSTLYGILFLKEPASPFLWIGIVLLILSLALIHLREKEMKRRFSWKWAALAVSAAVGNAVLICIQKHYQLRYAGFFQTEFMFYAMLFVGTVSAILLLVTRTKMEKTALKSGGLFAFPAGMMNAAVNLLVMSVSVSLPLSLVSPIISAGGIIMTAAAALLLYRETLSRREIVGLVIGVVSIIFLSI